MIDTATPGRRVDNARHISFNPTNRWPTTGCAGGTADRSHNPATAAKETR